MRFICERCGKYVMNVDGCIPSTRPEMDQIMRKFTNDVSETACGLELNLPEYEFCLMTLISGLYKGIAVDEGKEEAKKLFDNNLEVLRGMVHGVIAEVGESDDN